MEESSNADRPINRRNPEAGGRALSIPEESPSEDDLRCIANEVEFLLCKEDKLRERFREQIGILLKQLVERDEKLGQREEETGAQLTAQGVARLRDKTAGPPDEGWEWNLGAVYPQEQEADPACEPAPGWWPPEPPEPPHPIWEPGGVVTGTTPRSVEESLPACYTIVALIHDYELPDCVPIWDSEWPLELAAIAKSGFVGYEGFSKAKTRRALELVTADARSLRHNRERRRGKKHALVPPEEVLASMERSKRFERQLRERRHYPTKGELDLLDSIDEFRYDPNILAEFRRDIRSVATARAEARIRFENRGEGPARAAPTYAEELEAARLRALFSPGPPLSSAEKRFVLGVFHDTFAEAKQMEEFCPPSEWWPTNGVAGTDLERLHACLASEEGKAYYEYTLEKDSCRGLSEGQLQVLSRYVDEVRAELSADPASAPAGEDAAQEDKAETKERKKRGKGVLNDEVGGLLRSFPSGITAREIADKLNTSSGQYGPITASAVTKTENWKQRPRKN